MTAGALIVVFWALIMLIGALSAFALILGLKAAQ